MEATSVFAILSKINCNNHTEKKNGLTFLSWAWAWQIIKSNFPDAYYTIYENEGSIPYFTDGKSCWVKTGVTIRGLEHIEYLPIMDFRNNSIPVEKVTSTDMNKAIQRSLTKACARHGLGLYIYAGEDLPDSEESHPSAPEQKSAYKPMSDSQYWAIIDAYARRKPTKTGGDYRQTWIEMTGAGKQEIAMFDKAVVEYMLKNNLQ